MKENSSKTQKRNFLCDCTDRIQNVLNTGEVVIDITFHVGGLQKMLISKFKGIKKIPGNEGQNFNEA